jgi:cell division protein FtsL
MLAKKLEETYEPRKKKKTRIYRKVPKTKYIFESDAKLAPLPSLYSFCLVLILLTGAIGNLAILAKKDYVAVKITAIQRELQEAEQQNEALQREIANSYDLYEIEEKAQALGMKKPRPDQYIRIKID